MVGGIERSVKKRKKMGKVKKCIGKSGSSWQHEGEKDMNGKEKGANLNVARKKLCPNQGVERSEGRPRQ